MLPIITLVTTDVKLPPVEADIINIDVDQDKKTTVIDIHLRFRVASAKWGGGIIAVIAALHQLGYLG